MRLVKMRYGGHEPTVGILERDHIQPLLLSGGQYQTLWDILEADDPNGTAEFLIDSKSSRLKLDQVTLLAPIDRQEVWAAGVTYLRSQAARIDESKSAAWCYQHVYDSPRPELFMKATPHRVVGPGQPVRIRQDAQWSVPEPELTLVLNSNCRIVGYTIGNDMSSRDIEGENPLYLPQAKVYDACCALGPCITLVDAMPDADAAEIKLVVRRDNAVAFEGTTNVNRMAHTFADLVSWLRRDNTFPCGAFLLTGTGIVPHDDFTLQSGDVVEISISGIGTLTNPVIQG